MVFIVVSGSPLEIGKGARDRIYAYSKMVIKIFISAYFATQACSGLRCSTAPGSLLLLRRILPDITQNHGGAVHLHVTSPAGVS